MSENYRRDVAMLCEDYLQKYYNMKRLERTLSIETDISNRHMLMEKIAEVRNELDEDIKLFKGGV